MLKRPVSILSAVTVLAGAMAFPAVAQDNKMKMESKGKMMDSRHKMGMMGKGKKMAIKHKPIMSKAAPDKMSKTKMKSKSGKMQGKMGDKKM